MAVRTSDPIQPCHALGRRVDDLFPNGIGETSPFAKALFRQAVLDEMSLTLGQSVYVSGANTASEHHAPKP